MEKKSGFGGTFFERFVHLYLAFVTMHKTYFEFLCKNSVALSTTLFHPFSGKYNYFFKKSIRKSEPVKNLSIIRSRESGKIRVARKGEAKIKG